MSGAYSSYIGTAGQLAGLSTLSIDGEIFDVVGSLSYSPSKLIKETLGGLNGIHGFSAKPRAGFIAAQIRDSGALSVETICAKTAATVVLVTAAGKTVTGTAMWFAGEPSEVDVGEATFNVRFEGKSVDEVTTG